MISSKKRRTDSLCSILFDTLAYLDKLSGYTDTPYARYAATKLGDKPPFLMHKKACGSYDHEMSGYLEIMYHALLVSDDSLARQFFRLEVNTKNFLVWLRCRERGKPADGLIVRCGDWRPIAAGLGGDMGFIPERDEIVKLFNRSEWGKLVKNLFDNLRRRLAILAAFRSDEVVRLIFFYLNEEEVRWKTKVS